jgi:hypothetical protein
MIPKLFMLRMIVVIIIKIVQALKRKEEIEIIDSQVIQMRDQAKNKSMKYNHSLRVKRTHRAIDK